MQKKAPHEHEIVFASLYHHGGGFAVLAGAFIPQTVVLLRCTGCLHADTITLPGNWTMADLCMTHSLFEVPGIRRDGEQHILDCVVDPDGR